MIDIPVMTLVFSDDLDHRSHAGIWCQRPVIYGDLMCRDIGINALVQFSQILAVTEDGFLLEVTHNAVCGPWGDKIEQKETIEENALGNEDQPAFELRGLGDLNKGH